MYIYIQFFINSIGGLYFYTLKDYEMISLLLIGCFISLAYCFIYLMIIGQKHRIVYISASILNALWIINNYLIR